jgi:hypothetical protein
VKTLLAFVVRVLGYAALGSVVLSMVKVEPSGENALLLFYGAVVAACASAAAHFLSEDRRP